ncbi:restriction endonuclease subunit S [Nocardia rhamnosiphila]
MTKLPTTELDSVATINPRLSRSLDDDETVSFLGMADVSEDGTTSAGKDRSYSDVRKGFTPFRNGDILIAKITPCFQNGKIVQAEITRDHGFGSTEFHVVRTGDDLDPRYLLHYLRRPIIRVEGERRMTGSGGQRRVPTQYVKNLQIPLPSIKEQRRIAAILDHADALRAKRREALARLDELTQSIFIDMFADRDGCELGGLLDFVTSGGRGWSKYYAEEGEVFVRSLDVRMNRVDSSDIAYVNAPDNAEARRTRTRCGDVLLTITGSRIGRAAPVGEDLAGAYVSQHVAILRPRTEFLQPQFLSAFLCHLSFGQRQIAKVQYGQTKPGLNFEQIRAFRLPSVSQELQLEYVDRAATLDSLKSRHKAALAELDALFASLQSRAFRGEL